MSNIRISQLPAAPISLTGAELVPVVQNGQTVQTTVSAIITSPSLTQTFITVSNTPSLANSRYLGATNGLTITDGGAQSVLNITSTGALLSLVNSGTGIQVKTSSTAITNRSIAVSGNGISISNGSGISGDPTLSLSGQILNFANASFNGLVALSTGGAITSATITGTANQIDVANGTGVGGNPTISITNNPAIPGSEGISLPAGTTGQRSVSPTNGTIRYNSSVGLLEAYVNNAWGNISSGSGVSSVDASGGTTGFAFVGGPITTSGTLILIGLLNSTSGGTGQTSYAVGDTLYYSSGSVLSKLAIGASTYINTSSGTAPQWTSPASITVGAATLATSATNVAGGLANQFIYNTGVGATAFAVAPTVPNSFLQWNGSAFAWALSSPGSVTSVDVSGGTTGLTTSGGPVTTAGTITLAGTLAVANGGTGQVSYTNGQLLIGNTTGNTLTKTTLTAGSGITITNGTGSITIAASGGGDVVGPASATDTAISLFDGTTGKLIKNSLVTVSAVGAIVSPQVGSIIPFYYNNQAAFPSAAAYHGALAHSHADGAMYFAHGGVWVRILDNGGPLGTPSSGTVTNLTGTASININGTVGATTPNTGVFTTCTATTFVGVSGGVFT
jgi:hypothetical protein